MTINGHHPPDELILARTFAHEPKHQSQLGRQSRQPPAGQETGIPLAILGVPFDPVTLNHAVDRIGAMIASRRPHQVVTANVDFLVQARRDVELRRILLDAPLVLCDGTPLLWASRLLGNALPERVAGADLVPKLIEAAAQKGWRLFFLGGAPEVAEQAVASLRARHPDLEIGGHYSPPFRPLLEMDHEAIARRIREAQPDLLLVSFGCPKAEKWIAMHHRTLGVPVSVGVGATIDFLAGHVKRAPVWMQRAGLEWTFRLAQEPRRLFARYMSDLRQIGPALLKQWWHLQPGMRDTKRALPRLLDSGWQSIEMPDRLDATTVPANAAVWRRATERHTALDLADVRFIDSTGMGLLLWLRKQFNDVGRRLALAAPSDPVMRALKLMRVEQFFLIADSTEEARLAIEREPAHPVTRDGEPFAWRGELTAENAHEVWNATAVRFLACDAGRQRLVIDLSGVRFIDSAGAGLMLRTRKLAERGGASVRFTGATRPVRNVLRLSKLDALLLGDGA